ncbi:hypothetical protein SBA5_80029 [Candidatus Sulfotelmatomonas gaucii]|uniref:Uncharacterized protein n=1 Tax=Candidatus Sulfuritelmatomonas gaucii TaxID=2043161 RepID=A0A2N9M5I2_9BACT|nr:hypothetical protein SBA5_80029 [Candidatus Sulfotelmatomonas gaucii]
MNYARLPTLKRGANIRCAYGALAGRSLMQFLISSVAPAARLSFADSLTG